jgi:hypothetical protein
MGLSFSTPIDEQPIKKLKKRNHDDIENVTISPLGLNTISPPGLGTISPPGLDTIHQEFFASSLLTDYLIKDINYSFFQKMVDLNLNLKQIMKLCKSMNINKDEILEIFFKEIISLERYVKIFTLWVNKINVNKKKHHIIDLIELLVSNFDTMSVFQNTNLHKLPIAENDMTMISSLPSYQSDDEINGETLCVEIRERIHNAWTILPIHVDINKLIKKQNENGIITYIIGMVEMRPAESDIEHQMKENYQKNDGFQDISKFINLTTKVMSLSERIYIIKKLGEKKASVNDFFPMYYDNDTENIADENK